MVICHNFKYAPLLAHIKIYKFIFTSFLNIHLVLRIVINQSYQFSKGSEQLRLKKNTLVRHKIASQCALLWVDCTQQKENWSK